MRDSDAFQNRPVSMNPKNNLLEIEEHMYILDDVEKPNVFRNMFPYSEIPKIPLMIVSCLITCRRISGSQIPLLETDSSPGHLIPRNRL